MKYCSLVDATMIWGCKKEMKLLYEKERQTIGCGIKGGGAVRKEGKGPFVTVIKHKKWRFYLRKPMQW